MKICGKCKVEKTLNDFALSASKGHQNYCRECNKLHKRIWIKNNRAVVAKNRLWSRYRLRQEDFDAMLASQNSKCAICKRDFEDTPRVDHDHACCAAERSCGDCVRGLLCNSCNVKVGWLETHYDGIEKYLWSNPL